MHYVRPMRPETVTTIRNALGLSHEEMGGLLGAHRSTVQRWERGDWPVPKAEALALEALKAKGKRAVREMLPPGCASARIWAPERAGDTGLPAPKRVVVGAHKAVRVEDTGAPDGGRPSPAPDAFPPSGARETSDRLESVCPDPLEVPAFLKRTG